MKDLGLGYFEAMAWFQTCQKWELNFSKRIPLTMVNELTQGQCISNQVSAFQKLFEGENLK